MDNWNRILLDEPDKLFLLNGLACGFPSVPDLSLIESSDCPNYASALQDGTKQLLDQLFGDELEHGKISHVTEKPLRIQAIGAVSKTGTHVPRPIPDCSRPFGNSLNSFTCPEKFTFQSLDDAIR